ncbi:MAG: hypothetical protein PHP37_00610 [Patescibacteria group bacterium]|nr:hypothetical protein [Patescibacteria group bacterium]
MKKIIRSYFLAFAEETGRKNFVFFIVLIIVVLILMLCNHSIINKDYLDQKDILIFLLAFGIPILNYILCKKVKSIFISMPPYENARHDSATIQLIIQQIITQREGSRIIFKQKREKIKFNKPIWGKGIIKKLKTTDQQSNWTWNDVETMEENILVIKTKISGRWKNSTIEIPVKIKIQTNKDFNPIEVFDKIQSPDDQEVVHLPKYFRHIFKNINEKNQEKIQKLITDYAEMKISESILISEVIDLLIFPERPFSNVKNVQICLEAPEASSCKGMVCGK